MSFIGTVTGLKYTAGTVSQFLSFGKVVIALLPFITIFGAIGFNSLKSRWWVLAAIACIIACLWFFMDASSSHDITLQHQPEVTPDNDLGEGFSIIGLGIGYKLSFALTALSLLSAIISLLPFKFNQTIEKVVDDTFEDGSRLVRKEFKRIENVHKSHKNRHAAKQASPITPVENQDLGQEAVEDKEDPTRFMPKQQ